MDEQHRLKRLTELLQLTSFDRTQMIEDWVSLGLSEESATREVDELLAVAQEQDPAIKAKLRAEFLAIRGVDPETVSGD